MANGIKDRCEKGEDFTKASFKKKTNKIIKYMETLTQGRRAAVCYLGWKPSWFDIIKITQPLANFLPTIQNPHNGNGSKPKFLTLKQG